MRQHGAREIAGIAEPRPRLDAGVGLHLLGEIVGNDEPLAGHGGAAFASGVDAPDAVGDLLAESNGAVAGNSPRRGGPDEHPGAVEKRIRARDYREADSTRVVSGNSVPVRVDLRSSRNIQ